MNQELKARVDAALRYIPKKGKLLEIGSYPFIVTKYLIEKGYDVEGLDKNHTKQAISVSPCDIETDKYPFKDNTFDIVLMLEVVEHLGVNPIHALKEAHRVLKPKGVIVITTPNILRLQNLKSIIFRRKQLATLRSLTQKESIGYMSHIREYTKIELKEILEFCKFEVKDIYMFEGSKNKLTKCIVFIFPFFSTTIVISGNKVKKCQNDVHSVEQ